MQYDFLCPVIILLPLVTVIGFVVLFHLIFNRNQVCLSLSIVAEIAMYGTNGRMILGDADTITILFLIFL